MKVDEGETGESKRGYRFIRPDIHPRRRLVLALSTISTRRHRTRRKFMRISHTTPFQSTLRHTSRRKSCGSVSSRERPPNDRHQAGGRCNRLRTHLASALEGGVVRLGGVDEFLLQGMVGVRGLRRGWLFLTIGSEGRRWANVGVQENALKLGKVANI